MLQRSGEGGYKEVTVEVTLDKQVISSGAQEKGSQNRQQQPDDYDPYDDNEDYGQQGDQDSLGDLFRFFR